MAKFNRVTKLFICILVAFTSPHAPADSGKLETAERSYLSGDYDDSKKVFGSISQNDLSTFGRDTKKRYYHLGARLTSIFEDFEATELHLKKLYLLDPDYELNVFVDPPMMFEIWSKYQREDKNRSSGDDSFVKDEESLSYFPFGVGHYYQGRFVKGSLFTSAYFLTFFLNFDYATGGAVAYQGIGSYPEREYLAPTLVSFIGLWGYETLSLHDQKSLGELSELLNWAPLGVGQAKNDETAKAIILGGFQYIALHHAFFDEDIGSRSTSLVAFVAAYAYSVFDAYSGTNSGYKKSQSNSFQVGPSFFPKEDATYLGMRLSYQFH